MPLMIHLVDVILRAVAMPLAASVREPVVPAPINVMVSVVIAIVTVLTSLTKVIAVPTGYATLPFAGIVNVLLLVSAAGCRMCLPASARTSV